MGHSKSGPAASLDRMLVGLLWGTHGLDRGYTLIPRVTAIGLSFVGLAMVALVAQAILLPQHRPWPVKLIAALNFASLFAGVACYRRGWWSGLRAVIAAFAIYTAIICALCWLGGFGEAMVVEMQNATGAVEIAGSVEQGNAADSR